MLHIANHHSGEASNASSDYQPDEDIHLTRNQEMVYSKLASLKRAAGAYELLDLLRSEGVNAIPTIYRALNELEYKGLVLHLASTKSFVALEQGQPIEENRIQLVCEQCQSVFPVAGTGILNAIKKMPSSLVLKQSPSIWRLSASAVAAEPKTKQRKKHNENDTASFHGNGNIGGILWICTAAS